MSKILEFDINRKSKEGRKDIPQGGYDYFAKAVLDSLCEDEEDGDNYLIQIEDQNGGIHQITDAYLNRQGKTVTLVISDSDNIRGI